MASIINNGREEFHISDYRPGHIKSSLFSAVVLACWDNVIGPMITKVWRGNENVEINDEIINYVSNHTLSGELCRQTNKNTIDPKFYVLSDLGYIFSAVIFNGHSKMGTTISSLSFIMAYKDIKRYLLIQDLFMKQVKLIVLKYRILQQKKLSIAVKYLSSYLKEFLKIIDLFQESSIPENICINETIFGETEESNSFELLDLKFLIRCVTSHLQTCGCTVVIGKSTEKINLLIRTLALFLSKSERYCSRYACAEEKHLFITDLWLQGICNEKFDVASSSKSIRLNSYPVSLVNVDTKTVQQTFSLTKHDVNRSSFIKLELSMLLQGEDAPNNFGPELFTNNIGDVSMLVQNCLKDLFSGPIKCSFRRCYIENFLSLLKQKALSLIAHVETSSKNGKESLDDKQMYQLKQALLLHSEPDFRIVLAAAEKMRPGFASFFSTGEMYRREEQFSSASTMATAMFK